jgi:3-hydroxybutyryl-CoA dehydratase
MMEKQYFEDCHVGDTVVTAGRTITETDLVLFAAHTADWFPSHSDADFARRTPLGEGIAPGMLVLAIGSALLLRLGDFAFLPKSSIVVAAAYKIRFHASTKIGDTIYFAAGVNRMMVADKRRGFLVIQALIKNQREETVISSTLKVLAGRRPLIGDDRHG